MQSSFPDLVYAALKKLTWCGVFPAGIQAAAPWLAMKHSARKALPADELGWPQDRFENFKASIVANVEHLYLVIKNLVRHRKTLYRGLGEDQGAAILAIRLRRSRARQ